MGEWLLSPTGKYSDSTSGCLACWVLGRLAEGWKWQTGWVDGKEGNIFFFCFAA